MKWIIARYKEDVSWADALDSFIVQKGEHMPNKGRDPGSYLWYIIHFYDSLEGLYRFTQGNPFDHCKSIVQEPHETSSGFIWHGDKTYTDNMQGSPHDTCNIGWFIKEAGLEYNKDKITFKAGCQFTVSAERNKRKTIKFL